MTTKNQIKISSLNKAEYNPQQIDPGNFARLKKGIKGHSKYVSKKGDLRLVTTITVNKRGKRIVGGHKRLDVLKELGQDWIHEEDITWVDMPPGGKEEKALNTALNNPNLAGFWDFPKLKDIIADIDDGEFDVSLTGFDDDELKGMFDFEGEGAEGGEESKSGNLKDKFIFPPFSVLNAREGGWQERKRAWISLGIQSELGRGGVANGSGTGNGGKSELLSQPEGGGHIRSYPAEREKYIGKKRQIREGKKS